MKSLTDKISEMVQQALIDQGEAGKVEFNISLVLIPRPVPMPDMPAVLVVLAVEGLPQGLWHSGTALLQVGLPAPDDVASVVKQVLEEIRASQRRTEQAVQVSSNGHGGAPTGGAATSQEWPAPAADPHEDHR